MHLTPVISPERRHHATRPPPSAIPNTPHDKITTKNNTHTYLPTHPTPAPTPRHGRAPPYTPRSQHGSAKQRREEEKSLPTEQHTHAHTANQSAGTRATTREKKGEREREKRAHIHTQARNHITDNKKSKLGEKSNRRTDTDSQKNRKPTQTPTHPHTHTQNNNYTIKKTKRKQTPRGSSFPSSTVSLRRLQRKTEAKRDEKKKTLFYEG